MERAIIHYIKKEAGKLDFTRGEKHINQAFDRIDSTIDKVRKREIRKARDKKIKEWKRAEKLNGGYNSRKQRIKGGRRGDYVER